jgi:glutamate N-acetyltransferase/amino-acid N-acetyltransferase
MAIDAVNGFTAAGVASGLKRNGKKDLGLIVSAVDASVAGVFTRNRVKAAPVRLDMERIKSGVCRAVVVNSGNANCCTGAEGLSHAAATARWVAGRLGVDEHRVLVASTGVIGEPLPVDKIETAVPPLVQALAPGGFPDLAQAIMTTDTVPKMVEGRGRIGNRNFHVLGIAKGAGMIRPDMATLLCFVVTDAGATPETLQKVLQTAVDQSFNRITIDGDTSTNDTVLLLANGTSGAMLDTADAREAFQKVLDDVLLQLAKRCVKDGEGATKLVEIRVRGARSAADARAVADSVAHSPLVKTALFGQDANWGRILGAAGRAGVPLEPDRLDLFFDDVQMVAGGKGCGKAVEKDATAVLHQPEFTITVDLNLGTGQAAVLTCDLSIDYVKINADYRS